MHKFKVKSVAGGLVTAILGLSISGGLAVGAPTQVSQPSSQSNFAGSFQLPQRWNDDYQPETRCGTPGSTGTYTKATRRWFKQTDAVSVANLNDIAVPITHTIKNARTQTTEISGKAKAKGDLAKYLTNAFGFSYVYEVHWSVQQVVGPYQLPPNRQGRLVWGFTMLDTNNQDVQCGADQTWHAIGKPYNASSPEARYSELRLDVAPRYGE